MKATHRLIDSVWTVEFHQVNETEVEIIKYSRDDPEGYERERELPQCTLIEDKDRSVIGILIKDTFDSFTWCNIKNCDRKLTVVNPKYVFGY